MVGVYAQETSTPANNFVAGHVICGWDSLAAHAATNPASTRHTRYRNAPTKYNQTTHSILPRDTSMAVATLMKSDMDMGLPGYCQKYEPEMPCICGRLRNHGRRTCMFSQSSARPQPFFSNTQQLQAPSGNCGLCLCFDNGQHQHSFGISVV